MNSDFKELLQAFNACEVEYLVVGAYAVIHYTQPRYTKDLDVWLAPSPENAKRVMRAFQAFGIGHFGDVTIEDFARPGLLFSVSVAPVRIDFLTSVPPLDLKAAGNVAIRRKTIRCRFTTFPKPTSLRRRPSPAAPRTLPTSTNSGGRGSKLGSTKRLPDHVMGFQTLSNPSPSKSFAWTVVNSRTHWRSKAGVIRRS